MTIKLTPQESEEYFYNALCNGMAYVESGYYLELRFNEDIFNELANKLKEDGKQCCYEDVIMELLRAGQPITLYDLNDEEDHFIRIEDVHERVQNTPIEYLMEMITDNDDADTADVIIQTVFLGGVIYG
jgi:hypothetical protein